VKVHRTVVCRLILGVFLISLVSAFGLSQEIPITRQFDFGPSQQSEESIWEDFTPVEPAQKYTRDRGYGFENPTSWQAYEAERHDSLSADAIRLVGPFRADVPPGKYKVYLLACNPGAAYHQSQVADRLTYGLSVQGKVLRKAEEFNPQKYLDYIYRGIDRNYVPGEDWYDIFVTPLFDEYSVDVDAPEGRIVVMGDRAWLAAMVIFPASRSKQYDGFIDKLSAERKAALHAMVPFGTPTEVKEQQPAELTPEEVDRGYRFWWRHPLRAIYPESEPEVEELGAGRVFVSLGEIEPVTLAIRGLKPLSDVRLEVGDVSTDDGSVLPPSAFEIEIVRYSYGFPFISAHGSDCTIVPSHIRPFATVNVPKDLTRQFWVRITVPEDAKPGTYDGVFRLDGENITPGEVKFQLTVLPFKLKDAYDCGDFYYGGPTMALWYRMPEMKELVEPEVERMLRFARRYYLAPTLGYDNFSWVEGKTVDAGTPGQHIEYDEPSIKRFKRVMDLHRRILPKSRPFYVLNHAMPSYCELIPWRRDEFGWQVSEQPDEAWLALRQYLAKMRDLEEGIGGEPFRYLLAFEETNGGRDNVAWNVALLQNVSRWFPRLERVATAISPFEARMEGPFASVLCTPGHAVPFNDPAHTLSGAPKRRRAVYQPANRFTYGFFLAAVGGDFTYREHFTCASGNPFNAFDGRDYSTTFTYGCQPGPDGLVPLVLLENWREGIDDFRYIKTLQEKVKAVTETGSGDAKAVAREAETFLFELLSSINPDENYYLNEAGYWDPEVYDHYRWEIAKRIEKLHEP